MKHRKTARRSVIESNTPSYTSITPNTNFNAKNKILMRYHSENLAKKLLSGLCDDVPKLVFWGSFSASITFIFR